MIKVTIEEQPSILGLYAGPRYIAALEEDNCVQRVFLSFKPSESTIVRMKQRFRRDKRLAAPMPHFRELDDGTIITPLGGLIIDP